MILSYIFNEIVEGVLFIIVPYTPPQTSLEGVLFMYAFKNANATRTFYAEDHIYFSQDKSELIVNVFVSFNWKETTTQNSIIKMYKTRVCI